MTYIALSRKYRPQTFDQVLGQDTAVRILKNQIVSHRIGHAYLFTGIRGTGKTTLAKIFAKAINCERTEDGNPCLSCPTCLTLSKDNQSDVIEIDGASNRGVDEIRDIREKAVFPPVFGRYKVYIIDEVHMLTKEAFNALLKILEEPPGQLVFIFATTEPNKLPVTILSRCQRFDVRPIPTPIIADQLRYILKEEKKQMEEAAVATLARRGDHSMRDALSLLDQVIGLGTGDASISLREVLDFLGMVEEDALVLLVGQLFAGDLSGLSETMDGFFNRGADTKGLFDQIIALLKEVLIVKLNGKRGADLLEMDDRTFADRQALGQGVETQTLYTMLDTLINERSRLDHSHLARLVLELSLYKLTGRFEVVAGETGIPSSPIKEAEVQRLSPAKARQSRSKKPGSIEAKPPPETLPEDPSSRVPRPDQEARSEVKAGQAGKVQADKGPDLTEQDPPPRDKSVRQIEKKLAVSDNKIEREGQKQTNFQVDKEAFKEKLLDILEKKGAHTIKVQLAGARIEVDDEMVQIIFMDDDTGRSCKSLLETSYQQSNLTEAIDEMMGKKMKVATKLTAKAFEDMDPFEKTKAIVEGTGIPVHYQK